MRICYVCPMRISPQRHTLAVLRTVIGITQKEMAEILACPVSTIKSRLYTALELLKAELAPAKARGV